MAWWQIFDLKKKLLARPTEQRPNADVSQFALSHEMNFTEQDVTVDKEHGASGTEIYGGKIAWKEYNPEMMESRLFENIEKMRRGDGSIRAALNLIKLPLLRTTVAIGLADESDEDKENLMIADVTNQKLFGETHLHEHWDAQLRNFLLMFDFGFSVTEKVWRVDTDGFYVYSRLAPRLPWTVKDFKVFPNGDLKAVIQEASKNGQTRLLSIPAPIYTCVMTWDKEGDNYYGQSILRPMYKHWFYKEMFYRLDAIRLDRWSTGIPDASIKEGYTLKAAERQDLRNMLMGLRGSERAYSMHPEQIEIKILTPGTTATDIGLMESVSHHDSMIFRTILAEFMTIGQKKFGNYGSSQSNMELFLWAEQSAASLIENYYRDFIIRPFCDLNFNMLYENGSKRPYPVLRFADVQKTDISVVSQALARLAAAKVITPDNDLENDFRKKNGLPRLSKEWHRNPEDRTTKAEKKDSVDNDPENVTGRPKDAGTKKNRAVNRE